MNDKAFLVKYQVKKPVFWRKRPIIRLTTVKVSLDGFDSIQSAHGTSE